MRFYREVSWWLGLLCLHQQRLPAGVHVCGHRRERAEAVRGAKGDEFQDLAQHQVGRSLTLHESNPATTVWVAQRCKPGLYLGYRIVIIPSFFRYSDSGYSAPPRRQRQERARESSCGFGRRERAWMKQRHDRCNPSVQALSPVVIPHPPPLQALGYS